MKRCSRCLTPDLWPGLRFDGKGVCSLCRRFDRKWGRWLGDPARQRRSREKLERLIRRARRKRRGGYEVLVPLSGGKDSLEVLRVLRERYGLSVLAYTFDNGFLSPGGLRNVRLAVEKLAVPHTLRRFPIQLDLMRHFLLKTGNLCGPCLIPGLLDIHRLARREGIYLIVFGMSKRTDAFLPDGINPWYFANVVRDGFGIDRLGEVWGKHPVADFLADSLRDRVKVINLPDFISWDEEAIGERLERTLGVKLDIEHSDCLAHGLANWLAVKRYGFGYRTLKLSALIRNGFITREEALGRLLREEPAEPPAGDVSFISRLLGISVPEILASAQADVRTYYRGLGNRIAVAQRNLFLGR